MQLAWPRLPGLILALIWMTARLVLPLQPDCPHHAAATAVASVSSIAVEVTHAVPAHAHHDGHTGSHVPGSDTLPSSSVECECAAHCCAASTVDLPHGEQIHETLVAKLATRAPLATNDQVRNDRIDRRQPPSTAPPAVLIA